MDSPAMDLTVLRDIQCKVVSPQTAEWSLERTKQLKLILTMLELEPDPLLSHARAWETKMNEYVAKGKKRLHITAAEAKYLSYLQRNPIIFYLANEDVLERVKRVREDKA